VQKADERGNAEGEGGRVRCHLRRKNGSGIVSDGADLGRAEVANAGGVFSVGEAMSYHFICGIAFGLAMAALANIAITWALLGGVV
jgi:hypothetical protein